MINGFIRWIILVNLLARFEYAHMLAVNVHRSHVTIAHPKSMSKDLILILDESLLIEQGIKIVGISSSLDELGALFILLLERGQIVFASTRDKHVWKTF